MIPLGLIAWFHPYGALGAALLLLFGVAWCREIWKRLPSDLEDFRTTKDAGHKGVILFYWASAIVILPVIIGVVWVIFRGLF